METPSPHATVPSSTTPEAFLAMRARSRIVGRRNRRLKVAGLLVLGMAGGATWAAQRGWHVAELPPVQATVAEVAASEGAAGLPTASILVPAAASRAVEAAADGTATAPGQTEAAPDLAAAAPAPTEDGAPAAFVRAAPPPSVPAMAPSPPATERDRRCEVAFARHQWSDAVSACTRAFDANPTAAVAMKVAHARWSRGQVDAAHGWAQRALELGSDDPDAYVLLGHAERQAGRHHEARAAYRKYLALAPRGWHAVRVRAALRALDGDLATSGAVRGG